MVSKYAAREPAVVSGPVSLYARRDASCHAERRSAGHAATTAEKAEGGRGKDEGRSAT